MANFFPSTTASSSSSDEDGEVIAPLQNMAEEIRVVMRIRPLNERELNPSTVKPTIGLRCWKIMQEHNAITQTLNDGITPVQEKKSGRTLFTYDKVFHEQSTTKEVYEYAAKNIVSDCVDGRNGSIFAYGQTSSGKTYTMQGNNFGRKGQGDGVVNLAAADLFQNISKRKEDRQFKVSASVIEVYNEEVRDLLVDTNKTKSNLLRIRENSSRGIFVNAVKKEANSLSSLLSILSTGEKNRIVAKTALNKRSSRSHLIFCILLESEITKDNNINGDTNKRLTSQRYLADMETSQVSTLNLIDLAGSESVRHRSAHSNEHRSKECGNINKSLLTLSRVISALGRPEVSANNRHIGYRDSKLTRVLQPSLSGNAKLAFVCCITTSGLYLEETKSTLQFAQRIKHVKTASQINLKVADKSEIIKRLQDELDDTKSAVVNSLDRIQQLENANKGLKSTIKYLTNDRNRALTQIKEFEKKVKVNASEKLTQQQRWNGNISSDKHEKRETTMSKVPLSSGEIKIFNEANDDLKDQVGFLSTVVKQLQGKHTTISIEDDSKLNGMPGMVRVMPRDVGRPESAVSSGVVSEITEPTRYGIHMDRSSYQSLISEEDSSTSILLSNAEILEASNTNVVVS